MSSAGSTWPWRSPTRSIASDSPVVRNLHLGAGADHEVDRLAADGGERLQVWTAAVGELARPAPLGRPGAHRGTGVIRPLLVLHGEPAVDQHRQQPVRGARRDAQLGGGLLEADRPDVAQHLQQPQRVVDRLQQIRRLLDRLLWFVPHSRTILQAAMWPRSPLIPWFTRSATPLPATEWRRTTLVAVVVCWLFVVFDGYDLIVYGNVILQPAAGVGDRPRHRGHAGQSGVSSGMMIGAVLAGRLSDAVGPQARRHRMCGGAVGVHRAVRVGDRAGDVRGAAA